MASEDKKSNGKKALGTSVEIEFAECGVKFSERAGTASRIEYEDDDGKIMPARELGKRDVKAILVTCARHGIAVECNADGVYSVASVG